MGRTLALTSPLVKGKDVEAFQRALTHNGYYHGPVNGVYGDITAQAAYRAKYWLGYLKADHVAGDRLYGYLMGAKRTPQMLLIAKRRRMAKPKIPTQTLGMKALIESFKYVGVTENPPNTNHQKFGVWYGMDRVAWCNIYVSYCYATVGSKAFVRGHYYSYVPTMDADARAGRNNLSIAHPVMPGDVIAFTWPGEPGGPHHTGLFVKWINKATGTFESLEGNTSASNNSNGGQVMHRKDRNTSEVRTFIHVGR